MEAPKVTLLTYDEILRALLIGGLFATAIFPGYLLVAVAMNRHIEQLRNRLDGMRTDRVD